MKKKIDYEKNELKKELENKRFAIEEEIAEKILSCLQSLQVPIGRHKLAGVLVGSLANYVFDNGYNISPYFGSLNFFSKRQVIEMIDSLIIEGCISFGGEEYPLLVLTGFGKAVVEGGKKTRVELPWSLEGKPVPPPSDKKLFSRLRFWRADQAKKEELPAFCIVQNKTLFELSERKQNEVKELFDNIL